MSRSSVPLVTAISPSEMLRQLQQRRVIGSPVASLVPSSSSSMPPLPIPAPRVPAPDSRVPPTPTPRTAIPAPRKAPALASLAPCVVPPRDVPAHHSDRKRSRTPPPLSDERKHRRAELRDDATTAATVSATVSARYDSSIVYLIDEALTRGIYTIFARWFVSYLRDSQTPGCAVIVGNSEVPRYVPPARKKRRFAIARTTGPIDGAADDDCDSDERTNDFERDDCDDDYPPYVRIDPNERYPIFELKRQLNYPSHTILISHDESRLSRTLTCDCWIELVRREKLERSMKRVSAILSFLTERYLNAYTDFAPDDCYDDCDDDYDEYDENEEDGATASGGGGGSTGGVVDRRRSDDDHFPVSKTVLDENDVGGGVGMRGDDGYSYLMSSGPSLGGGGSTEYDDGDGSGDDRNDEFYKFLLGNTMRLNARAKAVAESTPEAQCAADARIVAQNRAILREVAASSAPSGRLNEGDNISLLFDETSLPPLPPHCRERSGGSGDRRRHVDASR